MLASTFTQVLRISRVAIVALARSAAMLPVDDAARVLCAGQVRTLIFRCWIITDTEFDCWFITKEEKIIYITHLVHLSSEICSSRSIHNHFTFRSFLWTSRSFVAIVTVTWTVSMNTMVTHPMLTQAFCNSKPRRHSTTSGFFYKTGILLHVQLPVTVLNTQNGTCLDHTRVRTLLVWHTIHRQFHRIYPVQNKGQNAYDRPPSSCSQM